MPKFIAKPVVVDAFQNMDGVLPIEFAHAALRRTREGLEIRTGDGPRLCRFRDWVVLGPDGQFSVMHEPAFEVMFQEHQAPAEPRVKRAYTRREDVYG